MRTTRRKARGRSLRALTTVLVLALLATLLLAGTALAAAKPGKPTAKAPKGTIATSKPIFKWSKTARATKYELSVYQGSKVRLKMSGLKKTSWQAVKALPTNVTLTWKVRASNARGSGAWSKSLTFKIAAANPLTWTTKAPLLTPRMSPGVVAGSAGSIYVVGGSGTAGFLNSVEKYDSSSDTWVPEAPMKYARHSFGCAQATNGKIYVIAGWNGWFTDYNEEYDPATDTWTTKAPLYTALHSPSVVAASDGRVYVVGGTNTYGEYQGLTRVDAYDPATDTWTTVAPMPTGRWAAAGVLASDGTIYVIGGRAETPTTFTTVEAYDPVANTWTTKAPLPAGRSSLAAVATGDGKIYAIGGTGDGTSMLNRVDVYDLTTDTWSSETPLQTARYALGAAYVGGTIYAIGGGTPDATDVVEAAVHQASSAVRATAGPDQTVDQTSHEGAKVILDGVGSPGPDGGSFVRLSTTNGGRTWPGRH